ncbi:MAG: hypothetical protein H0T73_19360 [Ardenticatenales bacterium]|nr:hypothetical protein [Ardenticatenales bacterium]
MLGMIDGRRLKRGWDQNELGALLLGEPPYEYEEQSDTQARFTRLRQVSDFLRCRTAAERDRVLPQTINVLESSTEAWAKAGAIFLRQAFGFIQPTIRDDDVEK